MPRTLKILLGAHLVAGVFPTIEPLWSGTLWLSTSGWAELALRLLPYTSVAIAGSQLCLVALWAGICPARSRCRLPAVVAANAYIAFWASLPDHYRSVAFELPSPFARSLAEHFTVNITFTCILALATNWLFKPRCLFVQSTSRRTATTKTGLLQFSIRSLLWLTAGVALVLATAGLAKTSSPPVDTLAALVVGGLVAGTISTTSAWAILSPGPVGTRLLLATGVAMLGALPIVASYPDGFNQQDLWEAVYLVTTMTGILCGSLAIVRRCGYRLAAPSGGAI